MATIRVTASLNTKLKFFSEFENINPYAAISIEREIEPGLTATEMLAKYASDDAELVAYGDALYDKARKVVEKKIESDIVSAKGNKAKKISQDS